ncbi:hypothetical protein [Succinivibrio dextrinosolvens]|uniref:hypothetical protein n=1 Tax=Succinivibrio dextrinosolvens TaxID=83771 RepID=UPI001920D7C2|nr:hypothetical protein [Succinivibrio dextrinosolvens]
MFRLLSLFTLVMAMGVVFAPEATLNYVATVLNSVLGNTNEISSEIVQFRQSILNAVDMGKDFLNQ